MKKFISLILLLVFCGCTTAPKDTLMQVSTIDALLAGVYDGQMTTGELLTHGNFGIGTFDALDGEMIILDGTVYQALADGTVHVMPTDTTTPFAAVVNFDVDSRIRGIDTFSFMDFAWLKTFIDRLEPNKNLFLAVRIDGKFPKMKVRSVPKQQRPYPPLAEVAKQQSVFELKNISGTVVGFRCPAYVKGIYVPNYHLHFISDDRKAGGHVLDMTLENPDLQLDTCNRFYMVLTDREEFAAADLSQDRSHELEKVEK